LGLASVYGIVKQSGGEIRIESEPGQGTMVEILLPRASATAAGRITKKTASAPVPPKTPTAGAAVLVAEDEAALRKLVETLLKSSGYEVECAANGEEALEVFLQNPARFDLLLTDVVMPGMSGRHLADQARQRRPDLRVVYMTAYSASEIAEHGDVEPNVTVLAKPFTAEDLQRTLRQAVGEQIRAAGA
jgi:CheY-like chemotaxis protein